MSFLKRIPFYIAVIAVFFSVVSCENSQALFQENTDDWKRFGGTTWKFSNGELIGVADNTNGSVITQNTYTDFVLELEFKPDDTINSGVFIRCSNQEINPTDCYEANIWDLHPNQDFRTGAIVLKAVPLAIVETNNKWNTYKINADKNHVQVWVNGILTVDISDNTLSNGYIGLQANGTGEIKFRNVRITPLN
ncbi:hypothetical protein MTsPCn9_08010 [Croceitalea sp. MTPC9]|uniref:3-keto-disaccharide hydrolase n=1 Tax=unclassified Croceitalea TaxID=2632280 RepID=UPI002B3B6159|nr:hypothetical protein MTsPCn6_00700 [Croceitalea sp. MTPC6]GMN15865.1 hypothetical protein MTsPCn9_08010 [Croceitalea sp. MTPC9]